MIPSNPENSLLVDRFGRQVTYVRLSVTDRCDLRCVYCMSEEMTFVPREQLLTLEEMARLGKTFVELGVHKIRITGGEPLVRRNILHLFRELGQLDGLHDLTLTTNGTQLARYAQELKDAGVTRINISLDTLKAERFQQLTRLGDINKVFAGIDAALAAGFQRIKLNAVILKHRNDDEVLDLVEFAHQRGMDITFIEEMPLGVIDSHDRAEAYYSSTEILHALQQHMALAEVADNTGGPSRYFGRAGSDYRVGFISPHSHNFCDTCNRVRVTAEGRLLLCLGQEHSVDLREVLRANPDDDVKVREALLQSMSIKPQGHEFDVNAAQPVIFRHMSATGG
ncbi:MAG: GTP 3',8-cyclase MoaA [Thiothrix sp.]|uniref:GTP 3',8-cyclase MoaA n=1 Tax=Thiothrix sp. TaxID=1032 RepID=UPI0026264855|nr:GTP 3',8-cyclase MoaA [Thiothrix sp.]MDD5391775.1 GTP 3',8-cyclase MoaA [Thiothrix sp.]